MHVDGCHIGGKLAEDGEGALRGRLPVLEEAGDG